MSNNLVTVCRKGSAHAGQLEFKDGTGNRLPLVILQLKIHVPGKTLGYPGHLTPHQHILQLGRLKTQGDHPVQLTDGINGVLFFDVFEARGMHHTVSHGTFPLQYPRYSP